MIVDCDTHFFPKDAFDYLEGTLADRRPRLVFDGDTLRDINFAEGPYSIPGTTPLPAPGSGARYGGLSNATRRMEAYAELGIERQLVLPQFTGWWSYRIDPELAQGMAHSYNLAMQGMAADYPSTVLPVALVALQDVPSAIDEAVWARANGFAAVVLDYIFPVAEHNLGSPTATHREAWPFFAKCAELDLPIYFHAVQHGHRLVNLRNFQMDGLDIFTPSEAKMNLVALITTGLLDQYPGLKIIHAEQGAQYIRPLAQWLDSQHRPVIAAYEAGEGASPGNRRKLAARARQVVSADEASEKNRHLPSHYFRTNFFWTIETEEPELVDGIDFAGADRFLFATDYPHDDPGGANKFEDVGLLAANAELSESVKNQLRHENAERIFSLT